MNKMKRFFAGVFLACGFMALSFGIVTSWAADAKISFSDPSVMVGNEVTVNMKVSSETALGTAEIMLSYDPAVLEFVGGSNANGGAGSVKVLGTMDSTSQTSFQFNLKFKALQPGNTQINVTSQEVYDVNAQALSLSKQGKSTVKVTAPATYSKDATLKSLKVSPGALTPDFSPSISSYQVLVDGSTTDLIVNAVAANAGAVVSLSGEKGLKTGENPVSVKVMAEDKNTARNYTILVIKEAEQESQSEESLAEGLNEGFDSLAVTVDGVSYSVSPSFEDISLPEGFESETYLYKGKEVLALRGLEKDLLLLYLKDGEGNGAFYIYKEASDSWFRFVQVKTTAKAIVVVPLDSGMEIPEGFRERAVDIDGVGVTGWVSVLEGETEYCLFYAMNWNGEKNFYRYDLLEKTIQRYFTSEAIGGKYVELAATYNKLLKDYRMQFYFLAGVGLLALGLFVVVVILLGKGRKKKRKVSFEEDIPDSRIESGEVNKSEEAGRRGQAAQGSSADGAEPESWAKSAGRPDSPEGVEGASLENNASQPSPADNAEPVSLTANGQQPSPSDNANQRNQASPASDQLGPAENAKLIEEARVKAEEHQPFEPEKETQAQIEEEDDFEFLDLDD